MCWSADMLPCRHMDRLFISPVRWSSQGCKHVMGGEVTVYWPGDKSLQNQGVGHVNSSLHSSEAVEGRAQVRAAGCFIKHSKISQSAWNLVEKKSKMASFVLRSLMAWEHFKHLEWYQRFFLNKELHKAEMHNDRQEHFLFTVPILDILIIS